MNYKERIAFMLEEIDDDAFVKMIYGFVRRLYMEGAAGGSLPSGISERRRQIREG